MRRVIYVSRSLIGADAAALDALVAQSCTRNASAGLSGMLWFDGQNFAQVLEGEDDAVADVMHRIAADPRHTDMTVVIDRASRTRAFGDWGMIRSDDQPACLTNTTLLVGLSLAEQGQAARRLYDIVVSCEL